MKKVIGLTVALLFVASLAFAIPASHPLLAALGFTQGFQVKFIKALDVANAERRTVHKTREVDCGAADADCVGGKKIEHYNKQIPAYTIKTYIKKMCRQFVFQNVIQPKIEADAQAARKTIEDNAGTVNDLE